MEAPAIYVGNNFAPPANAWPRWIALGVAISALAVLVTAAYLTPSPNGVGTHEGLGMQPCGFLANTGYPCAGCGMTTSFAYTVRGNLVHAFIAQPFGMILCLLTAAAFWSGLYVAITGRPAYRLLRLTPARTHLIVWPSLTALGWAWKILAMKLGWH
jgi:hypothetical protein